MPVDKPDYDEIRRFGQTFTVVVNEVIQGMSANAIAAYVYLMGKPSDWTIRPTDVRKRYGWGEYTWRSVAKELRGKGVLFDQIERDGDGRVTKKVLYIGSQPIDEINHGVENQHDGQTIPLTINNVAEQQRGSSTPLQSKDSLQSKELYKGLDISKVPEEWKAPVKEYITHRKGIRKPIATQQALTRLINRLKKCEDIGLNADEAIAETIDRGWSDVQPEWLKSKQPAQISGEPAI